MCVAKGGSIVMVQGIQNWEPGINSRNGLSWQWHTYTKTYILLSFVYVPGSITIIIHTKVLCMYVCTFCIGNHGLLYNSSSLELS